MRQAGDHRGRRPGLEGRCGVTKGAYYNEIDPFAAEWLRRLMIFGHIAPGEIDERSIEDVQPDDLRGFVQCHFFAGVGVWSHALRAAGWSDDRAVWTGSCPCQPFSKAGEGAGFADKRHLWPAFFHLIRERRPDVVLGEQVPVAVKKGWFDLVADDFEGEDYAVGALPFRASDIGEPIERLRLYFAAKPVSARMERQLSRPHPGAPRPRRWGGEEDLQALANAPLQPGSRWPQPIVRRVDHGITEYMEGLHALGNALSGPAATAFIETVMETFDV